MKTISRLGVWVVIFLSLCASTGFAQVILGAPAFNSIAGGPFDTVNVGNLNVHFAIPVLHKAGRAGLDFLYDITYDSTILVPIQSGSSKTWGLMANGSYWGFIGLNATTFPSFVTYSTSSGIHTCGISGTNHYTEWDFTNYVYHDRFGSHPFGFTNAYINADAAPACPPTGPQPTTAPSVPASDGSGNILVSNPGPGSATTNVSATSGVTFGGIGLFPTTDTNGNQITLGSGGAYTDSLGQNVLTVSGVPPSATTLTYTPPSGTNVSYTVTYVTKSVRTNFGCSTVSDSNFGSVPLVDKITLPDGSFYQFSYEATQGSTTGEVTGRLASVTTPKGGSITYTYPTAIQRAAQLRLYHLPSRRPIFPQRRRV